MSLSSVLWCVVLLCCVLIVGLLCEACGVVFGLVVFVFVWCVVVGVVCCVVVFVVLLVCFVLL